MELTSTQLHELFDPNRDFSAPLSHLIDLIRTPDTQTAYSLIVHAASQLKKSHSPPLLARTMSILCHLANSANYRILLLIEVYVLPFIKKPLQYAAQSAHLPYLTAYFSTSYPQSAQNGTNFNNLSLDYMTYCCRLLQICAHVKTHRVHNFKQTNEISHFQRIKIALEKDSTNNAGLLNESKPSDLSKIRASYLTDLAALQETQDQMVAFFGLKLQSYLSGRLKDQQEGLGFTEILRYGETSVTSDVIARCSELMTFHTDYEVRGKALKIMSKLIRWGDIEALLVVNFTDHLQLIAQDLWKNHIYPSEDDQSLFYQSFLGCLQSWGETYPTYEHLDQKEHSSNDKSPVFELYRLLREQRGGLFPPNPMLVAFEKQSHRCMKQKTIRNQLVLKDIQCQEEHSDMQPKGPKEPKAGLASMESYYAKNRQFLLGLLTHPQNIITVMGQLHNFRDSFESKVEELDIEDSELEQVDTLIENGLQLIDLIQVIEQPYQMFLCGQLTTPQLKHTINEKCQHFLSQSHLSKASLPASTRSEKLKQRHQLLKSLMLQQRSDPLDQYVRHLSRLPRSQIRSKLRQRMGRALSSMPSSSAEDMNLELYTLNHVSRQSRDAMLKALNTHPKFTQTLAQSFKQDRSIKNHALKYSAERQIKRINSHTNRSKEEQKRFIELPFLPKPKQGGYLTDRNKSRDEKGKYEQLSETQSGSHKTNLREVTVDIKNYESYFSYMPQQKFKLSQLLPSLVIYQSPELSLQRSVHLLDDQGPNVKVQVQLFLTPQQKITGLSYHIDSNDSFKINDRSHKLPELMEPGQRYTVDIVAQIHKIPLNLPTITLFRNTKHLLDYILPLSPNSFFCDCGKTYEGLLETYQSLSTAPLTVFRSQPLPRSLLLFGQEDTHSMLTYWPGFMQLPSSGSQQVYLWQATFKGVNFMLLVGFANNSADVRVAVMRPDSAKTMPDSFYCYLTALMSRMVSSYSK